MDIDELQSLLAEHTQQLLDSHKRLEEALQEIHDDNGLGYPPRMCAADALAAIPNEYRSK